MSPYLEGPGLDRLVRDLREAPGVFARYRATETAAGHTSERRTVGRPEVGDVVLDRDVPIVPGAKKPALLRVTGGRTVTRLP